MKAIQNQEISKGWVLEQLVDNVSLAKQAEAVLDAEGKPTGEYRQNLNAANQALELIGKELGMFVDRKEIRTGPLDELSGEELKQVESALADLIELRRKKHADD